MAFYIKHAREQMTYRGIVEADVEAALTNRAEEGADSRPGCRLIKGFDTNGDILVVIVNEENFVVTVYRP